MNGAVIGPAGNLLISHEPEHDIIYTDALRNMQAASIACINYSTKEETTDIRGDAIYPTEKELAAIFLALRKNTTRAKDDSHIHGEP